MNDTITEPYADVDDLRIGMFVHLDLGWMAHPFPRGSFKLSSADQIQTIRSLGLQRLRWSPDKSDAPPPTLGSAGLTGGPGVGLYTLAGGEAAADPAPGETPQERSRRERCAALAAQREARQRCERRFGQASQQCSQALELVGPQPQRAREQAESLARELLEELTLEQEMSIRLLGETAGDKSALHAMNVAVISLLTARMLRLSADDMLDLGVGAMLHDIGKLDLPERVRHRDDHFSAAELQSYQEHVALGVSAGRRLGLRAGALLVIGQHHEHADGSGFPLRLTSERMSIPSRIVALANRYDRLCNPVVPSKALTPHEALSLLYAQGKNKFDTAIMGAFIKMMGVYPPGSAVQLTDDRYALVTSVNSSRPLKPCVLVHDPRVPRDEALLLDLELVPGVGIRRSLKPDQLPPAALDYLAPRPRMVYFFEPQASPAGPQEAPR